MATKKELVSRIELVKGLIESNGSTFNYTLPKSYNKEYLFKIQNEAQLQYKELMGR